MAHLVQSHAVHTLYNDHQGWLHSWLRNRLGNTWDAADLVHDTFVKVLLKEEWTVIREPRAYLTTIAHGFPGLPHHHRPRINGEQSAPQGSGTGLPGCHRSPARR